MRLFKQKPFKNYSIVYLTELYSVLCGDLNGKKIKKKKKEDMCIRIADSLYYEAETNTTLKSNYIKKNNYKIKIK